MKIIYYREGLIDSILADLFSFGLLFLSFYGNAKLVGSVVLDIVLGVAFFIMAITKSQKKRFEFTSWEEVKKFVDNGGKR